MLLRLDSRDGDHADNAQRETRDSSSSKKNMRNKSSSSSLCMIETMPRLMLVDVPLVALFALLTGSILFQHVYLTYVTPMVQSYKRGPMVGNFYEDFRNEFTYYNRHCSAADISTQSSNDLLIQENYSAEQAANVMLEHGAVAFRNVLSNETASELRAYLSAKNQAPRENLSYNEVFWEDGKDRLSLALGAGDHPIIAEALRQVGTHKVIKRTLEAILGPDPAIVEISTLTALNGASDQGIHSDSDWFGSSLLYSRTFLHSYSMFVALQDTSKDLGATTVCPGSHYCADIDLEDVCLDNGAFEVSTNGKTGPDGLLRKGDAFMFNQNVWHRGPANVDENNTDRIMFILTFVSRAKETPGDRRRQGLGTYYYQRWNMWGHTFSSLKDAAKSMIQPYAALRALGLWKPTGTKWGVTWLEQFSQQLANGDDFYADYELFDFKKKVLDYYDIPMFLRSPSNRWEDFIPETIKLWVSFLAISNVLVVFIYVVVAWLLARWLQFRTQTESEGRRRNYRFLKRLIMSYGAVCLVMYAALLYIDQTELAQSIRSGDIFVRPFPSAPPILDSGRKSPLGPTTLPERNDVLIGTRFDADFLASYNRFLDFHLGNRRWRSAMARAAFVPKAVQGSVIQAIVNNILGEKEAGIPTRFLRQNPETGGWNIMTKDDALKETRRAVLSMEDPMVAKLAMHLKYYLADARFGVARDTTMARRFAPTFVEHWMSVLFDEDDKTTFLRDQIFCRPPDTDLSRGDGTTKSTFGYFRQLPQIVLPLSRNKMVDRREQDSVIESDTLQEGDQVWVYDAQDTQWYEAILIEKYRNGEWEVAYNLGGYDTAHTDNIRKYVAVKEGDRVEVDYFGNGKEYFPGFITNVHPDGGCSVLYDDGELGERIGRENILLLNSLEE